MARGRVPTLTTRFEGDTSGLDRATAKAERNTRGFSNSLSTFAKGAGVAAAAAAFATLANAAQEFARQGVDAAVSIEASLNRISLSLGGELAAAQEEWAGGLARSLGLSKRAALETSAYFSEQFVNSLGASADEANRMSQEAVTLAADLAALTASDPTEVVQALGAAMRGEYDPLEKYGVNVTAAAVSQHALAMGLAETESELTEADKAQARYALILERSAHAAGQAEAQSGTLAGQQRTLNAEWENASAELGEALLPILTDLSKWLTETGIPAFREWWADFSAGMADFAAGIRVMQDGWNRFTTDFGNGIARIRGWWDSLYGTVQAVVDGIADFTRWITDRIVSAWDWAWGRVQSVLDRISAAIQNARNLWGDFTRGLGVIGGWVGIGGSSASGAALLAAPASSSNQTRYVTNQITVTAPIGSAPADIGSAVVAAIRAYERSNGSEWRG